MDSWEQNALLESFHRQKYNCHGFDVIVLKLLGALQFLNKFGKLVDGKSLVLLIPQNRVSYHDHCSVVFDELSLIHEFVILNQGRMDFDSFLRF
jgi:hypothetical protein